MRIVTHADFKRALQTKGVRLETLALAYGFSNIPASMQEGRLRVGMIRFVSKADTTGVYLKETEDEQGRGSFLGYDKAADWVFSGNVATNTVYGYSYKILMPLSGKYVCEDCGRHFVHFVGGMPQKVCGVCDGVDSEVEE
jgi:hypothetical protein